MASNAITATNLASWLPQYQAGKALSALESQLVAKAVCWTDWRSELAWGNILQVAITPNLGAANVVALTADLTLYDTVTTNVSINVNQWNYKATGVGYKEQMQNRPNFLTEIAGKCVYSVGLAIDTFTLGLFSSLTAGNVGTQGTAIDDDVLLAAVANLDVADVPREGRMLVVDPESMTDLMKIDKMIADSYVALGAVEQPNGLIGRSRYGCKVHMSNNLKAQNTSYHSAAMLHKEAIALIMSKDNVVDYFDWKEKFTNVVRAQNLFGATVVRATAGACINTRS